MVLLPPWYNTKTVIKISSLNVSKVKLIWIILFTRHRVFKLLEQR
jgi:hypothetical protein